VTSDPSPTDRPGDSRITDRIAIDRASALPRSDVAGLLVAGLLAAWLALSAARSNGSALGPLVILGGSVAAFGIGRAAGVRWDVRPAAVVVIIAAALTLWSWEDVVHRSPLGRPFGYANATGALFVQAVVAASLLGVRARSLVAKATAAFVAAVFVALAVAVGSTASAVLASAVLIVGLLAGPSTRRTVLMCLGVAAMAFLLVTLLLASRSPSAGEGEDLRGLAQAALSERRIELWSDALQIIVDRPLFGVGAGRFDEESTVARSDPDARHAHHEYLQLAAETGVVGGLLLVGIFTWGLMRLGVSRWDRGGASVVGAGVAALAMHACVDYVLHFPLLPITAAFLLGIAVGCELRDAPVDAAHEWLVSPDEAEVHA